MRILFICADYFPYEGACACLLNRLLHEGGLLKAFGQIDVLSVKKSLQEADCEAVDGVRVYRAMRWSDVGKEQFLQGFRLSPVDAVRGFAERIYSYRIEKKLFPHHFVQNELVNTFVRALKRIHAERYDLIVSISGHNDVMAAAVKFVKRTGQKLMVYQMDPCSTNVAFPEATRPNRQKLEREAFETASMIVTTPIIYRELDGVYDEEIRRKMRTIEFPNVTLQPVADTEPRKDGKIRCLFTGVLPMRIRDPGYTLRLFEQIAGDEIELVFAGVTKAGLPEAYRQKPVTCLGMLPLCEARKLIEGADVLVNIGNTMTNQIPSKIFEYISTGKPIVNICKNRNCPTIPYMEKYEYALNLFEEEDILEEQAKQLAGFVRQNRGKRMTGAEIEKRFESSTPAYCAEQMRRWIAEVGETAG